MSSKDYIPHQHHNLWHKYVSCGPVVLHTKVKGKIEKFTKESEKQQEHNHILSILGNTY